MTATVVIADDQENIRDALRALVAADPRLRVVGVAADADEAIELAREHRPDVALFDVKMPGGGGLRATRETRSLSPATHVVVLSAYDDRESVFQLLEAGAVGYLVKGTGGQEICDTLVRAARGESALSPGVAADVVHELATHLGRRSQLEERRRLRARRVEQALEPGAISTVFQPIVELAGRRPVGYEALSRFGLEPSLPPDEWFRQADQVGLGVELELAALRSALVRLPAVPGHLFVSVNISPATLVSDELVPLLAAVPSERLVVETTEHAKVEDYEALRAAFAPLRDRGCRLAVDDAGAGFASLRHILELEPDIIKLDGSLTREIERTQAARALTSALLAFAGEMNQIVIAEAVENARMVYVLEALGVRYGQGYFLGRPEQLVLA